MNYPIPPAATVSCSIGGGTFLDSKDQIAVAGTLSNNTSDVQILEFIGDLDALGRDVSSRCDGKLNIKGSFGCMEACGVPRLSKIYLAISTYDKAGAGSIALVGLEYSSPSSWTLKELGFQKASMLSYSYSSLSFNNYTENLSCSTETGEIFIKDMMTYKDILSFKADACGVQQCKFLPSNELLILGRSFRTPIQLWDIRSKTVTKSLSSTTIDNHPVSLCCVCPVNNDVLLCGSTTGEILQWDLRTSRILSSMKLHNSEITSLMSHPFKPDVVLSTANNGIALCSNFNTNSNTPSPNDMNSTSTSSLFNPFEKQQLQLNDSNSTAVETIATDVAPLTSLDLDMQSHMVLVTSSVGNIWRRALAPPYCSSYFL
eukprot:gene2717-5352_t